MDYTYKHYNILIHNEIHLLFGYNYIQENIFVSINGKVNYQSNMRKLHGQFFISYVHVPSCVRQRSIININNEVEATFTRQISFVKNSLHF